MKNIRTYIIIGILSFFIPVTAHAQQRSMPEAEQAAQLLEQAQATFLKFNEKPKFQKVIARAKAVMLLPKIERVGILVSVKDGRGVLLTQDMNTGEWSSPAFYRAFSASVGVQIGVDQTEAALVIMSERALDGVLAGDFQLGADASVAIGSRDKVSAGSDIYTFTLVKGAFGGISLEGLDLSADNFRNRAFYGEKLTARDIIEDTGSHNPAADKLRIAMRGEKFQAAQGRKMAGQKAADAAEKLAKDISDYMLRNTERGVALVLSAGILFDVGSDRLQPGAVQKLKPLAEFIKEFKDQEIEVAGHADNTGGEANNFTLSKKRADAVMNALISMGIESGRISSKGQGEDVPIATNATPEGRQQNRRVEIVFKQLQLAQ